MAEPPVPTLPVIQAQLVDFLSSFSRQQAKSDFVIRMEEKLDLAHAWPEKLAQIQRVMETLAHDPIQPLSARDAGNRLTNLIRQWEDGLG